MSAGWVAATNRGHALLNRRLGSQGALDLAQAATWDDARSQLARSMYGTDLAPSASRAAARVAAATVTSWQLQVLAGWCPAGSSGLARLFAAPLEMLNIEHQFALLTGPTNTASTDAADPTESSIPQPVPQPISLGPLGIMWPRLRAATTPEHARRMLLHSSWGDPGGVDRATVAFGLRLSLLRRIVDRLPDAKELANGAIGVLLTRERFVFEREIVAVTGHELDRLIGTSWRQATSVSDMATRLPKNASWSLTGIDTPSELWRAEVTVAKRASTGADQLAASPTFSETSVAGIMALLLLDLRRVTAAIEVAGRGPLPQAVLDAVA